MVITRTAAVTRDEMHRRAAGRAPSRLASRAAVTGRAGQAITFIAHATPMATPASTGCERRAVSASARHISASTGGSVMPTASERARMGEATPSTAYRRADLRQEAHPVTECGKPRPNATASNAADASASQGLGSPISPGSPAAFGRPKTVMAGKYGL